MYIEYIVYFEYTVYKQLGPCKAMALGLVSPIKGCTLVHAALHSIK